MTTLKAITDGQVCKVPIGMSITAALALVGNGVTRRSVSGQLRALLYGMGVCQKCRVTVNEHRVLVCQTECQPKMVIERGHHAERWL